MKYKEFIPCRKCRKTPGSSLPEGYYYSSIMSDGTEYKIIKECDHYVTWRDTENHFRRFIENGFSSKYFDISFPKDYKGDSTCLARLSNYVNNFDDDQVKRCLLYFVGKNGTQKTATANWIGRDLSKNHCVKYILMKSLITKLWDAQRDETLQSEIDDLIKSDLVIIDECFDSKKNSMWSSGKQVGYIDTFIRERITLGNGIIFISNNDVNQIEKNGFSYDIQNLIERETKLSDSKFYFNDNYSDLSGSIPKRVF